MEAGAADGLQVFSDQEAWDVVEDIPNDSAAALILVERHWAVPLRDAIARTGAFGSASGSSALDLVEIGLMEGRLRRPRSTDSLAGQDRQPPWRGAAWAWGVAEAAPDGAAPS